MRYARELGIPRDYDDWWHYREHWRDDLPLRTRLQYVDFHTFLPGLVLTKVDRTSMAVSLEAREPLLDHKLLEFAARVPVSMKIRNGRGKYLLRKLLERRVPRSITERGKSGFAAPIGDWLRGPLADMASGLRAGQAFAAAYALAKRRAGVADFNDLIAWTRRLLATPGIGELPLLRLHGDCHGGNVLWTDAGPHFVDFDDARMGPAVQDLWMMLSGERHEMVRQLSDILAGYEDFCEFEPRQLYLVEALRTLRLMHYAAWLARRWDDPAFPAAFPWFNTQRYWQDRILELRDEGEKLSEIAVLYRSHYQSLELQMELSRRLIPYEIRSGVRFFEQAHIKDVLAYLKVVAQSNAGVHDRAHFLALAARQRWLAWD